MSTIVTVWFKCNQNISSNAHSLPCWASFNMASDGHVQHIQQRSQLAVLQQAIDALPRALFPTPLGAAYGSEWFSAEEMDRMEEQQHQQQQQHPEERVLKKLRSELSSPYANTSSPSGPHSSADLGAVSKAASKATPPFTLAGALTTAAPASQDLQQSTQPQPQHHPSQLPRPQMQLCKCGVDCVTALRAWDEAHNVHVEDEPQPTG